MAGLSNIGDILRYFLAGAFFLMVDRFFLGTVAQHFQLVTNGVPDTLLFPVAALVVGGLAYCVHRVLTYPVIRRVLVWFVLRDQWRNDVWWRRWCPWIALQIDIEHAVWRTRVSQDERVPLSGWGAEIQFLYLVALMLLVWLLWHGALLAAAGAGALRVLAGLRDASLIRVEAELVRRGHGN